MWLNQLRIGPPHSRFEYNSIECNLRFSLVFISHIKEIVFDEVMHVANERFCPLRQFFSIIQADVFC